jgi:hypothetical protein
VILTFSACDTQLQAVNVKITPYCAGLGAPQNS